MTKDGPENVEDKPVESKGNGIVRDRPTGPPPPESFSQRLKSAFRIKKSLLTVKLLVFLIHGGVAALFPFFTLHMKSLGISVKEMAFILLLLPLVSSIGPPLGGALADRIGNYKIVLIIFSLLSILFHTLLWFAVPAFGKTTTFTNSTFISQPKMLLSFPCDGSQPSAAISHESAVFTRCKFTQDIATAQFTQCRSTCEAAARTMLLFTESDGNNRIFRVNALEGFLKVDHFVQKSNITWALGSVSAQGLYRAGQWSAMSFTSCYDGEFHEPMLAYCSVTCEAAASGPVECSGVTVETFGDRLTTLALYFLFRFLSFTALRVVFPLLDAAILEIAKEKGGDFGIQRLFASFGFVIVPPISSALIGWASKRNKFADYSPAFYLFGAMNLLGTILLLFMKITIRPPSKNIWSSVGKVMKNMNVLFFTIAIFVSGAAFGVLVNFLFLFMENDKNAGFISPAPKYLLGLTNSVGYLIGIPLLFFSSQLIRLIGHENLIAIGLLCYAGRFFLYSVTYDVFHILPIEALTAVTGMVIVIAPQFAMATDRKYLATLVALFGAVNFGLGGAVGPMVSGLLVAAYGYRFTFQICGIFCAAIGVLYLLMHHFWLKKLKKPIDVKPAVDAANGSAKDRADEREDGEAAEALLGTTPTVSPVMTKQQRLPKVDDVAEDSRSINTNEANKLMDNNDLDRRRSF